MLRWILISGLALMTVACGSTPKPAPSSSGVAQPTVKHPLQSQTALPDRAAFYQKDRRWAHEQLGHSDGTLGADGCLVTATSMALVNLGFKTDPSDLNRRLTQADSFTPRGWLIWDGIRKVTDGQAKARFYKSVDAGLINQCIVDGYYPLVQFYLPNGRSHWAVILDRSSQGYRMRDPLRHADQPLIFPHGADKFRALRCVGLA